LEPSWLELAINDPVVLHAADPLGLSRASGLPTPRPSAGSLALYRADLAIYGYQTTWALAVLAAASPRSCAVALTVPPRPVITPSLKAMLTTPASGGRCLIWIECAFSETVMPFALVRAPLSPKVSAGFPAT